MNQIHYCHDTSTVSNEAPQDPVARPQTAMARSREPPSGATRCSRRKPEPTPQSKPSQTNRANVQIVQILLKRKEQGHRYFQKLTRVSSSTKMVQPKGCARQPKSSARASSVVPAQIPLNKKLKNIFGSGDERLEATLTAMRAKFRQLEETVDVVFTAALKEFPDEVLDRPFRELMRQTGCPLSNSQVEPRENMCSGIKPTTGTRVKKVEKSTKRNSKFGSIVPGGRQSRATVRNTRSTATSRSLPPKGVITPKFDTRRGRTPSLTRKAKPGEVLVSLSGSPVRAEDKLQYKTAAIITLGNGKLISFAPDTDSKRCKVERDDLAKLHALQRALSAIVKNSAMS
ncbi:uncharacterized protein LOC135401161 [Ornithodoros turicata]|uniref:uncharacterized protein LOC135401161 n=1 Tax=Ornithodoros turicata TaxID=34597 RepID=UPI00313893C7